MANYLGYLVLGFFAALSFSIIPFSILIARVLTLVGNATHIILSEKISDRWKEKSLAAYAGQIFMANFRFSFYLIGWLLLCLFVAIIVDQILGGFFEGLASWRACVCLCLGAVPVFFQKKQKDTYSPIDKALHRFLLQSPELIRFFNRVDRSFSSKKNIYSEKHVFITGLARAGTTAFLNELYKTKAFSSLTYRHMPFVGAPLIAQFLSEFFSKKKEAKPRAHGDGINIDFDSPEAFDEVFWRGYDSKDYIRHDCLIPYASKSVNQYASYVARIVNPEKRYLCKNNNNILRLPSIRKAFPNALIFVLFRDPVQQAGSLLNQHKRFLKEKDLFVSQYMKWLGHYEFGPNHKPFRFSRRNPYEPSHLNYWIQIWCDVYGHLLEDQTKFHLVSYEKLCEDSDTIKRVSQFSQVSSIGPFKKAPFKEYIEVDSSLLERAQQIHERLLAKSL